MGRESTLALILGIVVFVLGGVIVWHILETKDDRKGYRKRWDTCLGLKWCDKAKDCKEGEVCYKNACIPRKLCTGNEGCSSDEKCYQVGEVGYCVPGDDRT